MPMYHISYYYLFQSILCQIQVLSAQTREMELGIPGGQFSTGIWVGGFGRLNETLTLWKTQKM